MSIQDRGRNRGKLFTKYLKHGRLQMPHNAYEATFQLVLQPCRLLNFHKIKNAIFLTFQASTYQRPHLLINLSTHPDTRKHSAKAKSVNSQTYLRSKCKHSVEYNNQLQQDNFCIFAFFNYRSRNIYYRIANCISQTLLPNQILPFILYICIQEMFCKIFRD